MMDIGRDTLRSVTSKMEHDPRKNLCAPPLGIRAVKHCCDCNKKASWRVYILMYTFVIYITYHMSRLPISIVKSVLHRNCTRGEFENLLNKSLLTNPNTTTAAKDEILMKECSWIPFEGSNYEELYGTLDYAFLLCYALGLFVSGQIAERTHIRYFLTIGMIFSGFFVILFGLGHTWRIHSFAYYLTIQILGGFAQSSGWPCVVTCVANWFGDTKKGLILGIWNTHINIGNILGALVPGIWVKTDWGMSFMVPGLLIMCMGVTVFFWIVPYPEELDFNAKAATEDAPLKDDTVQPKEDKPNEESSLIKQDEQKAITIMGALKIPGVVEFSIGLFFIKLVSYTFLFWLPKYISSGGTVKIDPQTAASLTALFDVGGMFGGILIGLLSDILGIKAILCVVFLISAAWPMFHVYQIDGSTSQGLYAAFLIITGCLVNGPYALITTAVSAELGNHPCLNGNARAMSTVAAIIDGTGSLGAAFGPLITGIIATYGWNKVFAMLIISDIVAAVMLMRLFVNEAKGAFERYKNWKRKRKEGKDSQDTMPLEENSKDVRQSPELEEHENSKDR